MKVNGEIVTLTEPVSLKDFLEKSGYTTGRIAEILFQKRLMIPSCLLKRIHWKLFISSEVADDY